MDELALYQNLLGSTNAFNSLANRGATTQSTINLNDVLKTAMEEDDDEDSSLITDVEGLPDNVSVYHQEHRPWPYITLLRFSTILKAPL